jgi:hypothetical protein
MDDLPAMVELFDEESIDRRTPLARFGCAGTARACLPIGSVVIVDRGRMPRLQGLSEAQWAGLESLLLSRRPGP